MQIIIKAMFAMPMTYFLPHLNGLGGQIALVVPSPKIPTALALVVAVGRRISTMAPKTETAGKREQEKTTYSKTRQIAPRSGPADPTLPRYGSEMDQHVPGTPMPAEKTAQVPVKSGLVQR